MGPCIISLDPFRLVYCGPFVQVSSTSAADAQTVLLAQYWKNALPSPKLPQVFGLLCTIRFFCDPKFKRRLRMLHSC